MHYASLIVLALEVTGCLTKLDTITCDQSSSKRMPRIYSASGRHNISERLL